MDMQELALESAALKALGDAISERQKAVRVQMQEALTTSGASRLDAALPDGTKVATVFRTDPKPTAAVVDPELFLKWVREHSPANVVTRLVTEIRPAYTAALLAEMTAIGSAVWADRETGEVHDVPGVEIKATRAAGHSVRPVDGGREAIAEAWRTGALAHLSIPQITGGAA
ncbi:hypothetical protein [Streptomyces sp. NBC_01506]|uniref:hypothetical protein n=1 Tax=Streptomyces sp. NBC_01506 TaxID=2903887 RepID=UPI003869B1F9